MTIVMTKDQRKKYKTRPMTQSAAMVKLRSYVNKCTFSASVQSIIDPKKTVQQCTIYTLQVGEGVLTEHDSVTVKSYDGFEEAFEMLSRRFKNLGLVKGKKGKKQDDTVEYASKFGCP